MSKEDCLNSLLKLILTASPGFAIKAGVAEDLDVTPKEIRSTLIGASVFATRNIFLRRPTSFFVFVFFFLLRERF